MNTRFMFDARWLLASTLSPAAARVIAVLALCVLTVLLLWSDIRYTTDRSALISGVFNTAWSGSRSGIAVRREDPSMVLLTRHRGDPIPYLAISIPRPRKYNAIRVSADMLVSGVVEGPYFWQRGRVLLWSYDSKGKRLRHLPFEVIAGTGATDWRRGTLVVPVVPDTASARLVIAQAGLSGTMLVRHLSADAVSETDLFRVLKGALIFLWIVGAGWVVLPLILRRPARPATVLVWIVGLAIVAGTLAPQPQLSDTFRPVTEKLESMAAPVRDGILQLAWSLRQMLSETVDDVPVTGIENGKGSDSASAVGPPRGLAPDWSPRLGSNYAHLVAFMVLGMLAPFGFSGVRRLYLFGYLVLLSVVTELVQGFTLSRGTEAIDFVLNGAGIVIGLMLAMGLNAAWARFHNRHAGAGR